MLARTLSSVACHLSGVWPSSTSSFSMSWNTKQTPSGHTLDGWIRSGMLRKGLVCVCERKGERDRKSTRLNYSHL